MVDPNTSGIRRSTGRRNQPGRALDRVVGASGAAEWRTQDGFDLASIRRHPSKGRHPCTEIEQLGGPSSPLALLTLWLGLEQLPLRLQGAARFGPMGRLTSLFFASLLTEDHTMFIGQTIVAENTTGTTVYTPWFPRQGDAFTSSVEVIAFSSTGNLVISILDKDPDQTGDAPNAAVGSFDTITGVGTPSKRVSGLRPLVRYKIVLQRASGTGTIYATLRMLAPSWESTGAQGV